MFTAYLLYYIYCLHYKYRKICSLGAVFTAYLLYYIYCMHLYMDLRPLLAFKFSNLFLSWSEQIKLAHWEMMYFIAAWVLLRKSLMIFFLLFPTTKMFLNTFTTNILNEIVCKCDKIKALTTSQTSLKISFFPKFAHFLMYGFWKPDQTNKR